MIKDFLLINDTYVYENAVALSEFMDMELDYVLENFSGVKKNFKERWKKFMAGVKEFVRLLKERLKKLVIDFLGEASVNMHLMRAVAILDQKMTKIHQGVANTAERIQYRTGDTNKDAHIQDHDDLNKYQDQLADLSKTTEAKYIKDLKGGLIKADKLRWVPIKPTEVENLKNELEKGLSEISKVNIPEPNDGSPDFVVGHYQNFMRALTMLMGIIKVRVINMEAILKTMKDRRTSKAEQKETSNKAGYDNAKDATPAKEEEPSASKSSSRPSRKEPRPALV